MRAPGPKGRDDAKYIHNHRKGNTMKSIFSSHGTITGTLAALSLAALLVVTGCTREDSIVDPLNQPPAGVTNEEGAIKYLALADGFSSNTEVTMNDGEMYPADYGTVGKISADITPLRFGRFIRSVTRTVEVTFENGDSIAIANVTRDLLGVFRIRGINGDEDTVTVEKEFHDRSMKRVFFRRIAHDSERWWRNWIPVGTSLEEGGTVEPNDNIHIRMVELFLPNGDTVVVTDPLSHIMRYRWEKMLGMGDGMRDSDGHDRPPVPELADGQQLTMRVTVLSASPDTDLVALRFGCSAFHKRRVRMGIVSEEDNGDGTWTRSYERMWSVPPDRGFFHVAVDAMTHGTIFDDEEPYSVSWWGVPYRVF